MRHNHIRRVTVAVVLAVGGFANGQDRSVADAYDALLREYKTADTQITNAKDPTARQAAIARRAAVPAKMIALAEANPKDPVAVSSLLHVLEFANGSAFPNVGKDAPGERAMFLLTRDHLQSDRLGLACPVVAFGFFESHESFLRTVLAKSRHRAVQGLACLSLGQFLNNRQQRLDTLRAQDTPEMAERYYQVFGKAFVERCLRRDPAAEVGEAEKLFVRAAEAFGDVRVPATHFQKEATAAELAKVELRKLRHLAVGTEAPDIIGVDQDGKRFKLSDYRGKVVLLDFWYHG